MNPGISWLILGALGGLIIGWLKTRGDQLTDLAETEYDSDVAEAIAIANTRALIDRYVEEMVAEVQAEIAAEDQEADEFAANLTDTAIHQWIEN